MSDLDSFAMLEILVAVFAQSAKPFPFFIRVVPSFNRIVSLNLCYVPQDMNACELTVVVYLLLEALALHTKAIEDESRSPSKEERKIQLTVYGLLGKLCGALHQTLLPHGEDDTRPYVEHDYLVHELNQLERNVQQRLAEIPSPTT